MKLVYILLVFALIVHRLSAFVAVKSSMTTSTTKRSGALQMLPHDHLVFTDHSVIHHFLLAASKAPSVPPPTSLGQFLSSLWKSAPAIQVVQIYHKVSKLGIVDQVAVLNFVAFVTFGVFGGSTIIKMNSREEQRMEREERQEAREEQREAREERREEQREAREERQELWARYDRLGPWDLKRRQNIEHQIVILTFPSLQTLQHKLEEAELELETAKAIVEKDHAKESNESTQGFLEKYGIARMEARMEKNQAMAENKRVARDTLKKKFAEELKDKL